MNPEKLIVLDMKDERLQKAKEFGADLALNPGEKRDVVAKVKELTGGYGCDIYIEATGHPSSVEQGLAWCASWAALWSSVCSEGRPPWIGASLETARS